MAEQRPPKPKVRGSTPWSDASTRLDVAKWSKAAACKADGESPHPFESDRRVQFSSPVAQLAERLAVRWMSVVARAKPAAFGPLLRNVLRGCALQSKAMSGSQFTLSRCGADGSARDLGSRGRRFETCHRDQLQACAWVWP